MECKEIEICRVKKVVDGFVFWWWINIVFFIFGFLYMCLSFFRVIVIEIDVWKVEVKEKNSEWVYGFLGKYGF